jgi:hypothetical protein
MKLPNIIKNNYPILAVLLLAFTLRAALSVVSLSIDQNYHIFDSAFDTLSYINPAKNLIELGQFSNGGKPEILRTPGYSLFLIPGIISGHIYFVTIFLQIVLSCCTVYLIYKIALIAFDRSRSAIFCALLYAIDPLSVMFSTLIMSETLFTTLITLFLYQLIKYFTDNYSGQPRKQLFFAALTLIAAIYVRPIGYYLPFLITALLFVWIFTKKNRHKILIVNACIFLIFVMGSVGIWQIRNYVKTGYSGFSAVSDYNLYCYNGATVMAYKNQIPRLEMSKQLGCTINKQDLSFTEDYFMLHPERRQWSQSKIYRNLAREGKEIIRTNFFAYAMVHLEGMLRLLISSPASRYAQFLLPASDYNQSALYQISDVLIGRISWTEIVNFARRMPVFFAIDLSFLLLSAFYYLGVGRALLSKRLWNKMSMILLVSVAAYFLVLGGIPGNHRMRNPMMPMICLLAGYGWWSIADQIKPKNIRE